jgi:hypothetical protein
MYCVMCVYENNYGLCEKGRKEKASALLVMESRINKKTRKVSKKKNNKE